MTAEADFNGRVEAKLDRLLAILEPAAALPHADQKNALTMDEFLIELNRRGIKRGRDWLGDQVRSRRIRRLAVGKPYMIPRSELGRIASLLQG